MGAPDASITMPPDGAMPAAVAKVGGVIAISERKAFCEKYVACASDVTYAKCMEYVDLTATIEFAVPGCSSPAKLEAAMSCMKSGGTCSSCAAAIQAWDTAATSQACELELYSIGVGDRWRLYVGGDSQCDGGIRAQGGWCTHACSNAQQCVGVGDGGKNRFGTANTCGKDSLPQGYACYPTCTSTAHCQAWYGEMRDGLRIACKKFDDGSAPEPICVRVNDNRGTELP